MEWIASWSGWISLIGGIIVLIGAAGTWYQQSREQARTLDAIIGGKSYCIAHVGSPDDPAGLLLTLEHLGDFPLYDLVAYVADQGEVKVRGSGENAPPTALAQAPPCHRRSSFSHHSLHRPERRLEPVPSCPPRRS
jgi:hypothetical protein